MCKKFARWIVDKWITTGISNQNPTEKILKFFILSHFRQFHKFGGEQGKIHKIKKCDFVDFLVDNVDNLESK